MFIAISNQEEKEQRSDTNIAKAILSIREAIKNKDTTSIAKALKENELPHRTVKRFELAIEWGNDIGMSEKQIKMWKEVKDIYAKL